MVPPQSDQMIWPAFIELRIFMASPPTGSSRPSPLCESSWRLLACGYVPRMIVPVLADVRTQSVQMIEPALTEVRICMSSPPDLYYTGRAADLKRGSRSGLCDPGDASRRHRRSTGRPLPSCEPSWRSPPSWAVPDVYYTVGKADLPAHTETV